MIRLFVAVDFPEPVRASLAGLCAGVPGARWVDPANFHLTLRFIGEVESPVAQDIDAALARVHMPRFELWLRDVGCFGRGRGVRALWAGVAESDGLRRLQSKVENAVSAAGIARETRRFTPHVTLARLRGVSTTRLQRFVAEHADFMAGPVPVDGFTLYSSFLSSSGAIHTPEAFYALDE
jgi:2'-5' RNA ligase